MPLDWALRGGPGPRAAPAPEAFPPGGSSGGQAWARPWRRRGRAVKAAEIPPAKWVDAFLVFEASASPTSYLRLELPGTAVGSMDNLQFRIPRAMVQNVQDAARGNTSSN